ncbi:hypothetical protein [Deinococcus sp.]|uniref:hypothetical protein n=1 Tax=Deinococcus sp. TaxID=47478 RepID=UPI0025B8861B|nr:hypothetical protein [Deinococcus sp.]
MNNEKELIGRTGAVTGVQTPDPKEGDPSTIYLTTPPENRVGGRNQSTYQPVKVPDPQEVTGQFDQLATRDPQAMEQRLQTPEYAGSEGSGVVGGPSVLDAVVPSAGLGVSGGAGLVGGPLLGNADQNPGYTPPSKMAPPHISEAPAARPYKDAAQVENGDVNCKDSL